MPAKVTTARDRSKGKAKTPVTTTKGRANRQSVSKATVTQGGAKGTGTARVTTSKPTGSVRPSIGKVSGPASSPKAPPAKPTGPVRPSIGKVTGPASNPKAPAAAKPSGNLKAPSIPKTPPKDIPSPPKPSGLGSMRTGIAGAVASAATDKLLSPMAFKAGQEIGKAIKRTSERRPAPGGARTKAETLGKPDPSAPPSRSDRAPKPSKDTATTSRFAGARDAAFAKARQIKGSPVVGSKQPSSGSNTTYASVQPASTTTTTTTSSSSSPSTPAASSPASNAGMKNQDKNFRGNPNNPRSIASTLKELASIRPKPKAQESNATTKKSPDGRDYMGPAYGETKTNNTTTPPAKRQSTLQEEIRKRRLGLM